MTEQSDLLRQVLAPYKAIAFGYWGAQFPVPRIYCDLSGESAGMCEGYEVIRLHRLLSLWPDQLLETLLHEYAHAVVAWLDEHRGAADSDPHGRTWQKVMATFGYPEASPWHDLAFT